MAKLSYEYDDGDTGSSGGGSPSRLIALIVVIGALTAALIWWLMPAGKTPGSGTGSGKTDPAAGETSSAAGGETPATPSTPAAAADPGSAAVPSGTSSAAAATGDPAAGETPPAPAPETPNTAANAATGDPAADAGTPTPADQPPVKGKPWAGDPPETATPPPDAAELAEKATTAANALIFDSGKGAGVIFHTVKAGDAMDRIARNHRTTTAAVMRLNRMKKSSIRIGQKLAVLPGPWRIEVVKSQKKLRLYRSRGEGKGEELFFAFDIGIGRRNSTPTGDFVIYNHVSHPEWTAPDGTIFPYGDPGNPLGDYFLRLAPAKTPDRHLGGYGIHGSRDGEGVGLSISSGCIRMRNRDVELVFLAVPNGTPVSIKD